MPVADSSRRLGRVGYLLLLLCWTCPSQLGQSFVLEPRKSKRRVSILSSPLSQTFVSTTSASRTSRSRSLDVLTTEAPPTSCTRLANAADDSDTRPGDEGSSLAGQVGSGPNWIERSFPVDVLGTSNVDPKKVDDYNLGICGQSYQVGPLGARMYEAITRNVNSSVQLATPEITKAYKVYAMDFTAKEAVRAALKQNGLEMVLTEEEEDEGMWADIDSIRLLTTKEDGSVTVTGPLYDSWQDAVDVWKPGQAFHFVARQVPAKMRELELDELLQALDPKGELRAQAKEAGMALPGEDIDSLAVLASDNVRRVETAPRDAVPVADAYAGTDEKRGYRVVYASDLLQDSMNADGTEQRKTLMHVMEALVAHGCVIVDLTDGGLALQKAFEMAQMWDTAQTFFGQPDKTSLPGMETVQETGSTHAKAGYASYDDGNLQFLETRYDREGNLLPEGARALLGPQGCAALRKAFHIVTNVAKDVTRIAVSASSVEYQALDGVAASAAAIQLTDELLDDGEPLTANIPHSEGSVSMSPHRLCRYSNNGSNSKEKSDDQSDTVDAKTKEVFGAHTDSTFVTAVPVAAVAGLEVYDEDAEQWYRPELAALRHWQGLQKGLGLDVNELVETIDGQQLPWFARYVVLMPGELLQIATRNEILAAVHRVVATEETSSRLSAPILLRGRPGTTWDVSRYLGGALDNPLLEEIDGMTIEQIHDAMQPKSSSFE